MREASNIGAALSALTVESQMDVRQDLSNKVLDEYLSKEEIIKERRSKRFFQNCFKCS